MACAGNIGGQLGLFLGASLLTLFELFQFVLAFISHKLAAATSSEVRMKGRGADSGISIALTENTAEDTHGSNGFIGHSTPPLASKFEKTTPATVA